VLWVPKCVIKPHEILCRLCPSLWQSMRLKSKRNLTKPFTRGSTIQFVCYHGRPVGRAVMTANTGLRRTRKRQAECGVSATILPRNSNRPSNSETRDKRTQAAVRYYECQGLGHFAKECATRLKRQENIPDPRGRGSARGRSGRLHPPPRQNPCAEKREVIEKVTSQGNE